MMNNNPRKWWQQSVWLPGFLAVGVLVVVYLATLQRDVNGSSHDYLLDVGEIQVALNVWGTIHYTGYPLFTILSAILTGLARLVGFAPAAAASFAAFFWSLLSLLIIYRLAWQISQGERLLTALTVLVLGLVETFWLHSVIAEVYSFSLLLTSLALLLGLSLREQWSPAKWLLLVFVLSSGFVHHRLLLLVSPGVLLLVGQKGWPWLRKNPRWVVYSILAFTLPFLAYLYLPIRAWQGSIWVYGQPGTWRGFWEQVTGSEVTGNLLRLPGDLRVWWDNLGFLAEHLDHQLPVLALGVGLVGLIWLARRQPLVGFSFLATTAAFLLFVAAFPRAVWVPAVLLPVLLMLGLGVLFFLHRLAQGWPVSRWLGAILLLVLAFTLFYRNLPFVEEVTRNPAGREVIETLHQLTQTTQPGYDPVVALPWGSGFFAAAYGAYVTGELEGFRLVDHRADFRSILAEEGEILIPALYLDYWPATFWQERLGEIYLATASPGVVAISQRPLFQEVPVTTEFDLGNGIRIRSASLAWTAVDEIQATIYWEARRPVEFNYSVAVHLVARVPPEGPADILNQADVVNPVAGWYPTGLWQPGNVVRDVYRLSVPPDRAPEAVRISLYRVDENGSFINSEWFTLPIP